MICMVPAPHANPANLQDNGVRWRMDCQGFLRGRAVYPAIVFSSAFHSVPWQVDDRMRRVSLGRRRCPRSYGRL